MSSLNEWDLIQVPHESKDTLVKCIIIDTKIGGKEPCVVISPLTAYYSRKHNNLYIQISCWDWRSKKHKVYNQDDFLRALHEHELIYYKVENESSSI